MSYKGIAQDVNYLTPESKIDQNLMSATFPKACRAARPGRLAILLLAAIFSSGFAKLGYASESTASNTTTKSLKPGSKSGRSGVLPRATTKSVEQAVQELQLAIDKLDQDIKSQKYHLRVGAVVPNVTHTTSSKGVPKDSDSQVQASLHETETLIEFFEKNLVKGPELVSNDSPPVTGRPLPRDKTIENVNKIVTGAAKGALKASIPKIGKTGIEFPTPVHVAEGAAKGALKAAVPLAVEKIMDKSNDIRSEFKGYDIESLALYKAVKDLEASGAFNSKEQNEALAYFRRRLAERTKTVQDYWVNNCVASDGDTKVLVPEGTIGRINSCGKGLVHLALGQMNPGVEADVQKALMSLHKIKYSKLDYNRFCLMVQEACMGIAAGDSKFTEFEQDIALAIEPILSSQKNRLPQLQVDAKGSVTLVLDGWLKVNLSGPPPKIIRLKGAPGSSDDLLLNGLALPGDLNVKLANRLKQEFPNIKLPDGSTLYSRVVSEVFRELRIDEDYTKKAGSSSMNYHIKLFDPRLRSGSLPQDIALMVITAIDQDQYFKFGLRRQEESRPKAPKEGSNHTPSQPTKTDQTHPLPTPPPPPPPPPSKPKNQGDHFEGHDAETGITTGKFDHQDSGGSGSESKGNDNHDKPESHQPEKPSVEHPKADGPEVKPDRILP